MTLHLQYLGTALTFRQQEYMYSAGGCGVVGSSWTDRTVKASQRSVFGRVSPEWSFTWSRGHGMDREGCVD